MSRAIGLGIDIASAGLYCDREAAHSDGRCAVLERMFEVWDVVEKEGRAVRRHLGAGVEGLARGTSSLNISEVVSVDLR